MQPHVTKRDGARVRRPDSVASRRASGGASDIDGPDGGWQAHRGLAVGQHLHDHRHPRGLVRTLRVHTTPQM
eukprot:1945125-Pyramimonas_sp.AAC.1